MARLHHAIDAYSRRREELEDVAPVKSGKETAQYYMNQELSGFGEKKVDMIGPPEVRGREKYDAKVAVLPGLRQDLSVDPGGGVALWAADGGSFPC